MVMVTVVQCLLTSFQSEPDGVCDSMGTYVHSRAKPPAWKTYSIVLPVTQSLQGDALCHALICLWSGAAGNSGVLCQPRQPKQ